MTEGIKDRVAIIGMGCTKFGERWDRGSEALLVEAAEEAFADAGVDPKDIQAGWVGTWSTGWTGQILSHALKLNYIPITRIENACATGIDSFRNACYSVAAGIYDIVIAAGVEKQKDMFYTGTDVMSLPRDWAGTTTWSSAPAQFALAATRYFHHYGVDYDYGKKALARIAVKNHHNGSMSPKAHFQKEVTLEQVVNAPLMAYPLGLFDCCGVSDGAACAIITRADLAKNFRNDYVLVKGLGVACGAKQGSIQDDYDFVHFPENVAASQMAYREAGIKDPAKEIDNAQVHDCFTITELITMEDLGFAPRGKAMEYEDAGFFDLEGQLAVNTDGGLKCFGHPIGASGLRMAYEVYHQLQGKCGPRQRKDPRLGMTHNLGGIPGSFTCGVSILGRRD